MLAPRGCAVQWKENWHQKFWLESWLWPSQLRERSRSPFPDECGFSCLSNESEVFPNDLIGLAFVGYFSGTRCTNLR